MDQFQAVKQAMQDLRDGKIILVVIMAFPFFW